MCIKTISYSLFGSRLNGGVNFVVISVSFDETSVKIFF